MADEASPYIDLDGLKRAVGILDARYAGAGHAHGASDIEGLTALIEGRAPLHHAHKMDEVVGLKTSLAGKADNGHVHSSLASDALEAGADLDALDLHLGAPALSLAVAPAGAAHLPEGVEGPALVACELLRWAAEDDFATRQTLADPDGGAEWQRFCASGEWTAWARTYTSASMPTPAEIGAADRVHGHVVADVEGLRAELDGKAAASHTHTVGEVESLQQTLDAKAPREHMHAMSDVTGLAGALAGKSDEGHLHEIADVVNLGSELAGKSPVTHGHDAATKVEAGFMSAADKDKLDGIADGATRVTAVSQLSNDMGYQNADQVAEAVQGGTAGMATQSWVESKGYQTAQQVSDEIDSRGYQTAQQVQAAVDAGTEDMATETWVEGLGYQTAAQVDAAVEAKGYATTAEMQAAVEQATDDMATQTWVTDKGYQNAAQVESAITAKGYQTAAQVESAITAKGYDTVASVDGKVEDAKTELTAAINSAVSTVYRVKGSCARADLPADPQTGDVWSLTDEDGMNVVWTGSAWDELGVPVDLTWDAITGKPSTFAPSAHTHAQADVEGLSAALAGKSDTGHGHVVADVSGLQAALDSKSDTGHGHAVADVSGLQTALDGKAPSSHSHGIAQVTGLQGALDGKSDTGHGHTIAQVTNLQAALDGKAASSHTHSYAGSSSAGGAATSANKLNVTQLSSQNLNDYRTPGTMYQAGGGNTCTNKPSGVDNFGMTVVQTANGWQTQLLYGSDDRIYTRRWNGTGWTAWSRVYTTTAKPTASEIGAAAASHTHSIANVSGLQAALDGKAASSHSHAASAITSGTLSADRLPTVPIAKGGTGATSASAARTALGITPANIGAAASSHSHPASQVTGLTASRALVSDGSGHPAVSAVTATELGYLDGVTSNVQTQLNGKAASSHSHSYLPLSGGTLTGAVTHNAKNNRYSCSGGSWINGKTATNVPIVFPTASVMDGSRYDPYMWGQNTDGDVWNFGAGSSNQVGFFGFNSGRTANGSDWSVYMNITTGRLTSTAGFTGALSGNATTATTLQTARTINGTSFNGGANITTANWGTARTLTIGSTGKSVNGSGNVSWSLSEIGAAAVNHTHSGYAPSSHNHAASNITSGTLSVDRLPTVSVAKGGTGATTAAQARTNLGAAASSHNHSAANITSGTLAVARGGTGVTSDDALRQKVLNFPSSADLLDYLGL